MVRSIVALALALGLAGVVSSAQAQTQAPAQAQIQARVPTEAETPPLPQPEKQAQPQAQTQACTNPDALGTSRTITVEPDALPRIGTMQYHGSLPLNDHEVVITFDDGPLPPYSNRVLDALAAECVKVTYFLVGQMAHAYPDTVRRIYNAGHVIGTHSLHHPLAMDQLDLARISTEIDGGIAAVKAAVGDDRAVAPFFRVPGLARSRQIEAHAAAESLAVWSADEVADDWHRGITPAQIVQRAMSRIEAHGHRGVLLLHDIHPATALALPVLLKELKAKGYKIVQAVPAGIRPASVPERTPEEIAVARAAQGWPRLAKAVHHVRARKQQPAETENDESFLAKLMAKKNNVQTAVNDTNALFNR